MVAIKDFGMPSGCLWDCPLAREDGGACQLADVRTSGKERPNDCPLIEVEERKVGKWVDDPYEDFMPHCSNCKSRWSYAENMNYCPNCGAKMVKE